MRYFNPRAHEGHDSMIPRMWIQIILFQSTCPRGARLIFLLSPRRGGFQSTCPRGARRALQRGVRARRISIHVPTRGTTIKLNVVDTTSAFQSTCPRGARRLRRLPRFPRWCCHFNPRAHEGHDLETAADHAEILFQSTCPRGARLRVGLNLIVKEISIHVPTRGTTR